MGRLDLLNAEPSSGALLMQPLGGHCMNTLEMPHGRILARGENLETSRIVLAKGDGNLATQNTAPQQGGRDCQSAQGMIKRYNLGFRRA
eukprot:9986755-Alexandrium_andersonii.AAC.1